MPNEEFDRHAADLHADVHEIISKKNRERVRIIDVIRFGMHYMASTKYQEIDSHPDKTGSA